jgi:hypothetical protein
MTVPGIRIATPQTLFANLQVGGRYSAENFNTDFESTPREMFYALVREPDGAFCS